MKTLNKLALAILAAFAPFAQAATDVCAAYALSEDVTTIRSVEAYTQQLTQEEKGLIHTTILLQSPEEAVSQEQAVAIFSDAENRGSLGGSVDYHQVTVNGKVQTIVRVTYYPGDNEYGAIFQQVQYDGRNYYSFLGQISDSEVLCLTYVQP